MKFPHHRLAICVGIALLSGLVHADDRCLSELETARSRAGSAVRAVLTRVLDASSPQDGLVSNDYMESLDGRIERSVELRSCAALSDPLSDLTVYRIWLLRMKARALQGRWVAEFQLAAEDETWRTMQTLLQRLVYGAPLPL